MYIKWKIKMYIQNLPVCTVSIAERKAKQMCMKFA